MNLMIYFLSLRSFIFLSGLISIAAHAKDSQDIAKLAIPSVVTIVMQDSNNNMISQGSGFFVERDKVLTNFHVVREGAHGYIITGSGNTPVTINRLLNGSEKIDLALLSVNTQKGIPLDLDTSTTLEIGEDIYAVGSPLGYLSTFTNGIVSAIRKTMNRDQIQISAPISHGSSGGPILNKKGKVIGVAVALVESGQNLNFAIPIKYYNELKTVAATSGDSPSITPPVETDTNEMWQKYVAKHHEWRKIGDWNKERIILTADQYKQECSQGDYGSCFVLAHDLRLKGKRAEIKTFFKKLCDSGKATGCYYLGKEAHNDGKYKSAVALFEKACGIDGFGCNDLVTIAMYKADYSKWKILADKACKAKNPDGCLNLQLLYNFMVNTIQNYERTCLSIAPTRENAEDCRLMAKLAPLAKSYPDAASLAVEARIKACKFGDLSICDDLDFQRISENRDKKDLLQTFEIANDINLERCRRGIMSGTDNALSLRSACLNVSPTTMGERLKIFTVFCEKGALWECTDEERIERALGENRKTKIAREKSERLTKALCAGHALGACDEYIVRIRSELSCIKNQGAGSEYALQYAKKYCKSSALKDPLKYARKELVAYKKILINLCKDGDENVCAILGLDINLPVYASIPEN